MLLFFVTFCLVLPVEEVLLIADRVRGTSQSKNGNQLIWSEVEKQSAEWPNGHLPENLSYLELSQYESGLSEPHEADFHKTKKHCNQTK